MKSKQCSICLRINAASMKDHAEHKIENTRDE